MTRIARTARIHEPQNDVIARLQEFFSQRPKLQVRALGSSTAEVEVRYSLLYDWTRVAPPRGGMAFAWRPAWHGFPSFGATLTVRPAGNETELVLEGSYEPPGGIIGRAVRSLRRPKASSTHHGCVARSASSSGLEDDQRSRDSPALSVSKLRSGALRSKAEERSFT